ncbi:MAG: hypothetical protein WHT65_04085 [Pseudothermotoga sp.]
MKGSLLTETVFSLLIISILLVFIFDSSTASLGHTNRIESEIETLSLLKFVYGYFSEYRVGNDSSQITPQSINSSYLVEGRNYPRVLSLNQSIESKELTINGQTKTIEYRVVNLQIEERPGVISSHTLVFGL